VPPSSLIKKSGILQRDPGTFKSWTDSTIIVTKDEFVHVYSFKEADEPPDN